MKISLFKQNLHHELFIAYREYFESKLAIALLKHVQLNSVVKKVAKNT